MLELQKSVLSRALTDGEMLYAIIDSGIYKEFHDLMDIEGEEDVRILLKEPYLDGYESAAPYLMALEIEGSLCDGLLHASVGECWLTFVVSDKSLDVLAEELREMIVPYSEAHGHEIIYRFYDPRNLANYLAIHDKDELDAFFGDIGGEFFTIDAANPAFLYHYSKEGILPILLEEEK